MSIVISLNNKGLIGIDDKLAFTCKDDMDHFSKITKTQGNVVMGSHTWKSIPKSRKPLIDRKNVIITRNTKLIEEIKNTYTEDYGEKILCISNISEAFEKLDEPCFVGGSKILKSLFDSEYSNKIQKLYLTYFDDDSEPENGKYIDIPLTKYKKLSSYASKMMVEKFPGFQKEMLVIYETYKYIHQESYERKYLDTLIEIMKSPPRLTRNGYTHSKFGYQFKYDCSEKKVPLLTTKKVAWKTCIKELLWFLKGQTKNQILQEQGVHIWDGNSSREFLDSRGLKNYSEGDIGPMYGWLWRHYGAEYIDCDTNYKDQGIDQLENCVNMLKNEKYSRRIIMTSWDPNVFDKQCLHCCHILIQFYVDDNDKLWLQFYQRSSDMFLGVPFNILSYSVLLHLMAEKTGIEAGGVVHCLGDCHVYADHRDAVIEQLKNPILKQPEIKINFKDKWEDYDITDFELIGYKSAEKISAPMSA